MGFKMDSSSMPRAPPTQHAGQVQFVTCSALEIAAKSAPTLIGLPT
jgi:hypothetical protein